MFKPKPIATLVAARLKERVARAEAAHAEGVAVIEQERLAKLQEVHDVHDQKTVELTDRLVESVIGPDRV